MKVAFICPLTLPMDLIDNYFNSENISAENLAKEGISMPLGIMYLSSYIKKYNRSVSDIGLIDYKIHFDKIQEYNDVNNFISVIGKESIKFTPDILAFSVVVSTSHDFLIKCIDILKAIWPKAKVVVGGFHATNFTHELLEYKNIDYIFRGEGEIALSKFLDNCEDVGAVNNIKGVYTKHNIINQEILYLCDHEINLDKIPLPDYDIIDMEIYTSRNTRQVIKGKAYDGIKAAEMMTTRGCPHKCTFCSSHTVHGRQVRYRSIENILEEVRTLYEKYGVTLLLPEDDLFTAGKTRTIQLLEGLRQLNIPNFEMQFPVALSVNSVDEQLLDELVDSGMKTCSLAIESGSEYVQKNIIKKFVNLDKAKRLVKYLKSKGVPIRCSFVIGFPNETKEQIYETIEFAKNLGADWNDFFIATPLPGSEMCTEFMDLGYIQNDIDMLSRGYYSKRIFDTKEISAKELTELAYKANLECNFINNINLINQEWEKAIKTFEAIVLKHPFHIIGWYCIMISYQHLRNTRKETEIREKIRKLINEDKTAYDMYVKYGDMISDFAS